MYLFRLFCFFLLFDGFFGGGVLFSMKKQMTIQFYYCSVFCFVFFTKEAIIGRTKVCLSVVPSCLANLPVVAMREVQIVEPVGLHGVVAIQRADPPQELFGLRL